MADKYITQNQENGSIMISEDVIVTIAGHAVKEVEGVLSLTAKPGADILEVVGKKNWCKGLRITVGQDDTVAIDCNVNIAYGHCVVAVGNAVQAAVTAAVESMAGIKVSSVNVNVCGIVRQ